MAWSPSFIASSPSFNSVPWVTSPLTRVGFLSLSGAISKRPSRWSSRACSREMRWLGSTAWQPRPRPSRLLPSKTRNSSFASFPSMPTSTVTTREGAGS